MQVYIGDTLIKDKEVYYPTKNSFKFCWPPVNKYNTVVVYNYTNGVYNLIVSNIPNADINHGTVLYNNINLTMEGNYVVDIWTQPLKINSFTMKEYISFINEKSLKPLTRLIFGIDRNSNNIIK